MKSCTGAVLYAVDRPWAAVCVEVCCAWIVEVACIKDEAVMLGDKFTDCIEWSYDFVSIPNGECAARAEVVLHIDVA